MQLGGTGRCERERRSGAPLAHQQGDSGEKKEQHKEVVAALENKGKELGIERDCGRHGSSPRNG